MCVFLVNSNEHLRVIRNRSMCGRRKEGSESGKWEVGSTGIIHTVSFAICAGPERRGRM